MKKSFSSLFKKYRERAKLTKADLAEYLQKTDSYIRKIENSHYTPPTYENCIALTQKFRLSETEKRLFLNQAFIERTKTDQDFYNYLTDTQVTENKSASKLFKSGDESIYASCIYRLSWNATMGLNEIEEAEALSLERAIIDVSKEFNCTVHQCNIKESSIDLIIEMEPTTDIPYFVKGLKKLTADHINENQWVSNSPRFVWERSFEIVTCELSRVAK